MKILIKTILNFEVITQTPLVFAFPDVLSDFNPFGNISVHQTKNNRLESVFLKTQKNTCQTFLMYLTGIMQLGVAKSFSAACVQYQLNNFLIIVIKIYIKLFIFIKKGKCFTSLPKIQSNTSR